MPRVGVATALFAMSLVLPAVAGAIPIAGSGPLGSFEGTLTFDGVDTVLVTLTNTSTMGNGGFITAFAFNIPGNGASGATLTYEPDPTDTDFVPMFGISSISASPLGFFDIGAAVNTPSWLGSGDPTVGIGAGDTANFTFQLLNPVGIVSAEQIMTTLSVPQSQGHIGYPFAVRFRGFENLPEGTEGDSDKVVGYVVPEPGTLLLLGGGLTALAMRRRRPRA